MDFFPMINGTLEVGTVKKMRACLASLFLSNKSGRWLQRKSVFVETQAFNVAVSGNPLRFGCAFNFFYLHFLSYYTRY